MKTNKLQAIREAQTDLQFLDSRSSSAEELAGDLPTCVPHGECSEAYRNAYYAVIEAARRACAEASVRAATLDRMAAGARDRAARLISYAEQREVEATRARSIQLADQRFRQITV